MAYAGFLRTLPTPTATLSGFVCLLNAGWFTQADANALDGTTFINGGGSLRIYTDATKATQLPLEVVTFVTGGTPEVQAWVRIPTYTGSATTVWVESDAVAIAQPAIGDIYGRNAVWSDYALGLHLESASGTLDSSGNATMTDFGTPSSVVGKIVDGVSLTAAGYNTTDVAQFNFTNGYKLSFWANISNLGNFANLIGMSNNLRIGRNSTGTTGLLYHAGGANFITGYETAFTIGVLKKYDLVWDESDGSFVIYADGLLTSATATTLTVPTTSATCTIMYRSGTQYVTAPIIDEYTFRNGKVSSDFITSEYDNQSSPSTFGTSSGWTTGGGGGVTVTGTAIPTQTEADIVSGGKTIILTLNGDAFVASGATFDAERQGIIDGLNSAQTETTGWNNEVRDLEVVSSVVRDSDTQVTITLTASAAYDITAAETITATIPASALVTGTSPIIATPTFEVTAVGSLFQVAWARNSNYMIQ